MSAWPFWTVVVGLMAILAWVLWRPEPMLAPGPVIEGHSAIASDCFACHRPFLGSPSEKCAACHEPARIGRFTTTGVPLGEGKAGFHQELLEQDCTACHLDHAGADARRAVRAY